MFAINANIEDYTRFRGKSSVFLMPDKALVPGLRFPVTWKGSFNGEELIIIQHKASWILEHDFEFKICPEAAAHFKAEIIELIDKKLRILD